MQFIVVFTISFEINLLLKLYDTFTTHCFFHGNDPNQVSPVGLRYSDPQTKTGNGQPSKIIFGPPNENRGKTDSIWTCSGFNRGGSCTSRWHVHDRPAKNNPALRFKDLRLHCCALCYEGLGVRGSYQPPSYQLPMDPNIDLV